MSLLPILLACAPLPAGDGLGGLEGAWKAIDHEPALNTGSAPDSAYQGVGWWLFVDVVDEQSGTVALCNEQDRASCIDHLTGPVVLEEGLAVWRLSFDLDDFQDPDFDCVLHEEFHAVLLPHDAEMTLISNAEVTAAAGAECEEAWAWMASLEGGKDDPDLSADVIQYNRLVRP